MRTKTFVAGALLSTAGCSGGGGGGGGQLPATVENLVGLWATDPDGAGEIRAFELSLEATPGAGHPYRLFLYPETVDAVEVQRGTFDVIDGVLVTTIIQDVNAFSGTFGNELLSVTENAFTIDVDAAETGKRTYRRTDECPIAERSGDWLWSSAAKDPYGYADTFDNGWVDLELGSSGAAMVHHFNPINGDPATWFGERTGCGFTHEPIFATSWANRLSFSAGERHVLGGLAAQPIAYARHAQDSWNSYVLIPASGFVDPCNSWGITTAADGTVYMAHTGNLQPNDTVGHGPALSTWKDGAQVAYSRITTMTNANTHPSLAVALDAAGDPVVAYTDPATQTLHLATTSNGGWSLAQLGTSVAATGGLATAKGGLAMARTSAGSLHLAWVADLGASTYEIRHTTNATGSWVTTPVGQGSWVDLALDAADALHLSFLRHDGMGTLLPYYATNATGSWVEEPVGAADSAPPHISNSIACDNRTAIAIDADGNVHIAAGDFFYATNAY